MPQITSKSTVFSLLPYPLHIEKPGMFPSFFSIEKSKDMAHPARLVVGDSFYNVRQAGVEQVTKVEVPSYRIAESIVEDYIRACMGVKENCRPGLFWVEGDVPLEKVDKALLKANVDAQTLWYIELVKIADDEWQKYRRHDFISDLQREAARFLNLEREWAISAEKLAAAKTDSRCPACMMMVDPEASICHACRTVINPAKYKQFQTVKA